MVTGRQPPVKATCFAGGYPLLFQIFWLRDSQGQVDGLLTLEMLNLLLQFAKKIQEYIQNQLKEDLEYDQMTLKEYIDPFTGEPVKQSK